MLYGVLRNWRRGGCDSILVRKITVRQPDHSGQPQWEVSRCYSSLLSELARLYCLFLAADSIVDGISFGVLFYDCSLSPAPAIF